MRKSEFQTVLDESFNLELRESNGKLNQTDRNAFRNKLLNALANDIGAIITVDGAIVEMEHEYWGSLAIEISLKMKDPDYDIDTARQEYVDKVEMALQKKTEMEQKAIERKVKSDALKALKEGKKVK